MAGFSKEQQTELKGMFAHQLEQIQHWMTLQFSGERAYYRQLLRDELAGVYERLDRLEQRLIALDERADEDVKAALNDIVLLKRQVKHLQSQVIALQKS